MSAHTKGPWTIREMYGDSFRIERVAWLGASSDHKPGENKANANLIAAAPELLEALEEMLASLEEILAYARKFPTWRLHSIEDWPAIRERAEAAIAKAKTKGGQP